GLRVGQEAAVAGGGPLVLAGAVLEGGESGDEHVPRRCGGGELVEVAGAAHDGVGEQHGPVPGLGGVGDDVHVEVADAAAEAGLDAQLQGGDEVGQEVPGC